MFKNKIFSIIASILAGVVMCGALVYYNFIDKPLQSTVELGKECPAFTVNTFKIEDGQFKTGGAVFSPFQHRGKVVVINFWATYCAPCKAELPDFNKIQEAYKEDVVVITLDGELTFPAEKLATWLNKNSAPVEGGWNTYSMLFGTYDVNALDVYNLLGFSSGALPATMIVNRAGNVAFKTEGSMHYEDLEREILPLL